MENLEKIESESKAMAYDMVTKDRVIEKYDPVADREKGIDSGVVYMKKKLIDSISKKPTDSAEARKIYVELVPEIVNKIVDAKTFDDLKKV